MVFSSLTFLFYFLPVFLTGYFIFKSHKNFLLLLFSLFFYAWGEPIYIFLMLLSITCNYICGRLIEAANTEKKRKTYLVLSIVGNLLMLFFFKYFNFAIEQLEMITHYRPRLPDILCNLPLPLGISFFTFQAMSYVIDVYRKKVACEKNLLTVATYITMFPQLVAGPIVRYEIVAKELHFRTLTYNSFMTGLKIFILGLAAKVILANRFSIFADEIFSHNPYHLSLGVSWIGVICYAFQIYFDFAGYSTMAIGLGKMLGFDFPENFNRPYTATSVTDFWRRWHISLSTWFRDYLYIPLGGNKSGTLKTYRNLLIVFVLCGLWHGASWNFLIWGLYYGLFLIIERCCRERNIPRFKPLCRVYLLLVVMVGWVFFRSPDLSHAVGYLRVMFGMTAGMNYYTTQMFPMPLVCVLLAIGCIACICRREQFSRFFEIPGSYPGAIKCLKYFAYAFILIACTVSLIVSQHNPFIYFRF